MPRTTRGAGCDRNVSYGYKLRTDDWDANYTLRIHSYFVESDVQEIDTVPFAFHQRDWLCTSDADAVVGPFTERLLHRLLCLKKENGSLGVYLHLKSGPDLTVQRSFRLVSSRAPGYGVAREYRRTHSQDDGGCGTNSLARLDDLNRSDSPYWHDESLILQVVIRVWCPENEEFSMNVRKHEAVCTWKIRNFMNSRCCVLRSQSINFGRSQWSLHFSPAGLDEKNEYASFCIFHDALKIKYLAYTLKALSLSGLGIVESIDRPEAVPPNTGLGSRRFMKTEQLRYESHGFVENRWLTLQAIFSVADTDTDAATETEPAQAVTVSAGEDPSCVFCQINPQTSGVLHGSMVHKCYCAECAANMKKVENLSCPLCHEKVDAVIDKIC